MAPSPSAMDRFFCDIIRSSHLFFFFSPKSTIPEMESICLSVLTSGTTLLSIGGREYKKEKFSRSNFRSSHIFLLRFGSAQKMFIRQFSIQFSRIPDLCCDAIFKNLEHYFRNLEYNLEFQFSVFKSRTLVFKKIFKSWISNIEFHFSKSRNPEFCSNE